MRSVQDQLTAVLASVGPVRPLDVSPADGCTVAPVGDPDAQSLSALSRANALAVVGEDATTVRPGDHVHRPVLEG